MPVALVTGATGLVGSYVVQRLQADGWTVRGLARSPRSASALERMGVEPAAGDVLDAAAFAAAARGADAIVHAAAIITESGGWDAYDRTNVQGTGNAVAAAEAARARLLQVSSIAVYGSAARFTLGPGGMHEDVPFAELPDSSWYARSKRDSERVVLDAHQSGRVWATAVRPAVVYGRRDRQFVPRMARLAALGVLPIPGGGRSPLALVHAANVADAAVLALGSDRAGGRAFNVANDFDVGAAEFFRLGGHGLGRRVRVVPLPTTVARAGQVVALAALRAARLGALAEAFGSSVDFVTRGNPFDSSLARRVLGWAPRVRPGEGVPDAFRWWKEVGSRE